MMHSSIKRALRRKQLEQADKTNKPDASSHSHPPQRYLPRLVLSKIGNTDPYCPHCQAELETLPVHATICLHCKNDMLVMTRPKDKATVLVNQEEAQQLQQEWEAYNERQDPYLREKGAHALNIAYSELWDQLDREPTLSEIKSHLQRQDNSQ